MYWQGDKIKLLCVLGCLILVNKTLAQSVRERGKEFILSDEKVLKFMKLLDQNIDRGLKKDTHHEAIVESFVTYVQDLPNGQEEGKFMGLDLGGTNFRVLMVDMEGINRFEMTSQKFAIPSEIMSGTGEQLFDHIADCMAQFMKLHGVPDEILPLGFTFSFPVQQLGLSKGILTRWTKSFNCSGVIGQDVVQLLNEAIQRRGDLHTNVCAILNDSTGTLLSCAYNKSNCAIGLIIGTGYNACYLEQQTRAELFNDRNKGSDHVIINTEFGAFGDDGCIDFARTAYDRDMDENSINPGKQLQEKMVGGMYMGELVRLALVQYTKEGLVFEGEGSALLQQRGQLLSKHVSEIEAEANGTRTRCLEICTDVLGLKHATRLDCVRVRYVCARVSTRAATIVSAGMATLLNRMNKTDVTIGVDGSVYRFHPNFHALMMKFIRRYTHQHINFELLLSIDGSGRGAALLAAVTARQNSANSTV